MPALALYLLAVFAGGALLAPWLYDGIAALAPFFPALETAARMPFARYVNRGLLIVALLGLPFFVRGAGVRRWSDVGLGRGAFHPRRFGVAFALGFFSLAAVCAVTLLAGGRMIKPRSPGELAGQLLGVLATALIVAVIEELLFRVLVATGVASLLWMGIRRASGESRFGVATAQWTGVIAAAVFVAVWHVGMSNDAGGAARVVAVNLIANLLYGWTWWRRGLEMAVLTHGTLNASLYLGLPLLH